MVAATTSPAPELEPPRRILVVDDEPAIVRMASRILTTSGYLVHTAGDGEEAWRVLQALDGPVHLIVTDIDMPVLDGIRLAARVLASRAGTPILYSSGDLKDPALRAQVSDGAAHFLAKPYSRLELVTKVRLLLETCTPGPTDGAPST